MGRHSGRSRGCQTCRDRRVKCDEAMPECSRCVRTGKRCPGAVQGIMVVDMTSRVRGPLEESHDNIARMQNSSSVETKFGTSATIGSVRPPAQTQDLARYESTQVVNRELELANECELPDLYQPSRAAPFQELLRSYFLDTFAAPERMRSPPNSWVLRIPQYVALAPEGAVKYSMRAVTMAFYGKSASDQSIQNASCQAYGIALNRQILDMGVLTDRPQRQLSSVESLSAAMIASALLLSMFETIMPCGNHEAWAQHLQGAAHLMEMHGPEACRSGPLHHLYRTVRVATALEGLEHDRSAKFSDDSWSSVPFHDMGKEPLDYVIDFMLHLSHFRTRSERLKTVNKPGTTSHYAAKRSLAEEVTAFMSAMSRKWSEMKPRMSPDTDFAALVNADEGLVPHVTFQDPQDAKTAALYSAVRMACHDILSQLIDDRQNIECGLKTDCAIILSCALWVQNLNSGLPGSFSMVIPLKKAFQRTPSSPQKRLCITLLAKWGKYNTLAGLCSEILQQELDQDVHSGAIIAGPAMSRPEDSSLETVP